MAYPQKHRTVGISMHPDLERRAKAQATSLGLKFSPYVTLCIEAEMRGMANILNKPQASDDISLTYARDYMEARSSDADFRASVEKTLKVIDCEYTAHPRIDSLVSDFAIQTPRGLLLLECCPHIHNHYPLSLGQAILLKSSPHVSEVVLIAPYLCGFDINVKTQLDRFQIQLCTPDTLKSTLKPLIERFS